MEINLGARIKYFRKRSGLKQMDLELRAGLPNGTISRIEHNKVNPSKETLRKIAEILKLHHRELDYLIGITSTPATLKEIREAIQEIEPYFEQDNVIAYLIDERWRFIAFSKAFIEITGTSQSQVGKIIGNTIIRSILDDKLPIKKLLEGPNYIETVKDQIAHYYMEVGFMIDDPYFKESLEYINKYPQFREFIQNLMAKKKELPMHFHGMEKRKIVFKFKYNLKVTLEYSREPLLNQPRFEIIEYKPTSKLLNLLSKLQFAK